METVTKTFEAVGTTNPLTIRPGESVTYSATESTFVGVAFFERSANGGQSWETIETATDASMTGGVVTNNSTSDQAFRFRTTLKGVTEMSGSLVVSVAVNAATLYEFKSRAGTVVFSITDEGISLLTRVNRKKVVNAAGQAKVGATAGFVVAAASNIGLVTCPASQTGSTLVIPLPHLAVGDTITGFHLVGQIESAGGAVTIDADLRKHTAAAADVADASVGAITQLAVTADTIMSSANTRKADLAEVVGADETFYVLVTVTTAGSTDVALQGVAVELTEV